jgi:hypothetical protein
MIGTDLRGATAAPSVQLVAGAKLAALRVKGR